MAVVLVVDDDFDTRESIVDLLLDNGIEAVSAKDGRDGLLELRMRSDVGLILLDLSMPMMDGRLFRATQLADPELAAIPVAILSGDDDAKTVAEEMKAAFMFAKPFQPDALIGALRSLH